MIFTITNAIPPGITITDDAYDHNLLKEFPVTFNGTTIGGAVLTNVRVNQTDRVVHLTFETDGLTGLQVNDLIVAGSAEFTSIPEGDLT